MNQNLTHRQHLHRAVPEAGAPEPLVQTSEASKERLVRQIVARSGPMAVKNATKHQHYLLTLHVDVLQQRLELLKKENQ